MMRRMVIPAVCMLVMVFATSAVAGSALSLLFPYEVNRLEDDDWEALVIDKGTSGAVDKGDVFVGMLEIQRSWNEDESLFKNPTYDTFTTIFALECSNVSWDANVGLWKFDFVPLGYDWANLTGLGLPTQQDLSNTMAIAYSDERANMTDKFIDNNTGTLKGSLETAHLNSTTELWEFGFDPQDRDTEFWYAYANTPYLNNPTAPLVVMNYYVSIDMTHEYPGGIPLLKHNELYNWAAPAHIQAFGGLSSSTAGPGDFHVVTDGDWYIKPTPEPGSIALLGLGLVACAGMVYRRRKNNA